MNKTYHLALIYGSGRVKFWGNNHYKSTCILVAKENLDLLPTDINEYIGKQITTKKSLKASKKEILDWINTTYGKQFQRLIID